MISGNEVLLFRIILIPSTRRQISKARKSREMDMLFDYENMDVLLSSEDVKLIERELANTISGSISHDDTEAFSQ